MSKKTTVGVIDMILSIVTKRNMGSGNWTGPIIRLEVLYLFLINKIAMIRKLSIQFEWRYRVFETHM
jgi:hypothetical protein